jgi:hypothetical protein
VGRKREDAATVGDLEDFAETVKKSFGDLAESVKGKVVKAPEPKDDDTGKGDDKGGDDNGDGGGDFVPSWGKVSSWFGSS